VCLGIKSKPQASLLWQMDIEFRQCALGVAKLDWLKKPRRSEIGLLDCFISKLVSLPRLSMHWSQANSKRSHHCEVTEMKRVGGS
jgi:hypothetical protein